MAFTTLKSNHNNHQMTTPSYPKPNNPKSSISKHRLNFTKPSSNPKTIPSAVIDHPVEVIGRVRDYPNKPFSKHRLNFAKPSSNPNSIPSDVIGHPVEVIARIRDYPGKPVSSILDAVDSHSLRVRTDFGHRYFALDGVSVSRDQDLDGFYTSFVQSRVCGVKLGEKCTIVMYGPTGSGKSHTLFGCANNNQQGIVYSSLKDILGEEQKGSVFVRVTVLEIYNEEIFDLLLANSTKGGGGGGGGFAIDHARGNASKVKLEVMGKKAKNATSISGTEAGKISKEIQKAEKRRIVKSTFCNETSSRSHCMIILDVPTVGGRLMLVDIAGSENIAQAGQTGFEAKMQTAKINQGNIALRRVVESIANGDSHVPFRDSKLTMLLQDSFEDDKSKVLMILCMSPDPKEMHKTISTLEYGAKAKCIVHGPHTPIKADGSSSSDVVMGSRIAAVDQLIGKLQMENKIREKEKIEAQKQLMKKEEEIEGLRAKLAEAVEKKNEEEINMKVTERENMLKRELEKKIEEYQQIADDVVEMERRKMEDKIFQQQVEVEMLRRCLEELELELTRSRDGKENENRNIAVSSSVEGNSFAKLLMDIYADEDYGIEKSMDLDQSLDLDVGGRHNKMIQVECDSEEDCSPTLTSNSSNNKSDVVEVVVKWEAASVENGGGVITTLRLVKDLTLADLRKLIETYLDADEQAFTFLAAGGDPTDAPVAKEDEASVIVTKLPTCSNSQTRRQHLACLRPPKKLNSDLNVLDVGYGWLLGPVCLAFLLGLVKIKVTA